MSTRTLAQLASEAFVPEKFIDGAWSWFQGLLRSQSTFRARLPKLPRSAPPRDSGTVGTE